MCDAAIQSVRAARLPAVLRLAGDDRLAKLAAAGDRDAFAAIYARHHQELYRYCRSILGSSEDAADALQNAMARALTALEGERREIALKPWLYRIAHNEAISLLRRRRPQAPIEDELEARPGPSLEATTETRERLRQLMTDLWELSERQRGALLMRELSGLSYAELAGALGTSVDAAKQTVFEGRTALHELSEGRDMACEAIRRSISDRDGRVLRGRRVRAHLRDCGACRDFRDLIETRGGQLQAIAPPLPAAAAAAILESLLGGGGGGGLPPAAAGAEALAGGASSGAAPAPAASGIAAWLPGGAGALGAGKGLAAVAATLALGGGAAGVASQISSDEPPGRAAEGAPSAAAATPGRTAPADDRDGSDAPRGADERARADKDERSRGRDERDDGASPGGTDRSPASAPGRGGAAPPLPGRGSGPPPTSRRERERQPAGGRGAPDRRPPAAEENADARIPERGTQAPAPQAPAGTPTPEPPDPAPDAPAPSPPPATPAPPPGAGR